MEASLKGKACFRLLSTASLVVVFTTGLLASATLTWESQTSDDADNPPYPVFPTEFVGVIKSIWPANSPPPPEESVNWTYTISADASPSKAGKRRIRMSKTAQNWTKSYTYLMLDKAPYARPGSRAANYNVIIAEDGGSPPQAIFVDHEPRSTPCQYTTYWSPWYYLPLALGHVFGYGGFKCDDEGGACVPTGLKYQGVVTLDEGRKAHHWHKSETFSVIYNDTYDFFTDLDSNLPIISHAWRTGGRSGFFPLGFESLYTFNITPGVPPDSAFSIREGSHWTEECENQDLEPTHTHPVPDRIYGANSTTDDCFMMQLGDQPVENTTHVTFVLLNSSSPTNNCTLENPCVSIEPDSLVFTTNNWAPQRVCLHYLRTGESFFEYRVSGGGYDFSRKEDVMTCEHGPSGSGICIL